jgi:spore coat protein CotH
MQFSAKLVFVVLLLAFTIPKLQAETLDGDKLLDPNHLVDIRITLSPSDWKELCKQRRDFGALFSGAEIEDPFNYFKGDISIDGHGVAEVGVRKKGLFGSVDSVRPSLKIKFDEFVDQDPIKGLSRLTLNNNKQDTSQVSQFLTYKLFRDAGVHAPRSNFARVTVNDVYLGIYTHVESIKKPFLANQFGDKSGQLFEGTLTDFHPRTIEKFEAKTKNDQVDRRHLKLIADIVTQGDKLQVDKLQEVIDLDNFFRYWALEGIVRFWDGYAANQNNFYFYIHPADGRGYFIPWGADDSFTKQGGPFGRFTRQKSTAVYATSMLTNRLYHTEGMADRYRATVLELLDEVWDEQELIAEIDRIEKLISSHLHERQKSSPRNMNRVRDFIETRRGVLEKELNEWPAVVSTKPRKPQYTIVIGKASGSFTTVWNDRSAADPTNAGNAEIQVELDGEVVEFKQLGISVQPRRSSRFGRRDSGATDRPRVSLVLAAIRAADDERLTITLAIDREAFENLTDDPIQVTGTLTVGRNPSPFAAFGGGANRSVNGVLRLTKSGTDEGAAVAGNIELTIAETRGGLFRR